MQASFTVEFPEHVPLDERQYALRALADDGGAIDEIGERTFAILCTTDKQLRLVGWALFHTRIKDLCRVISVAGAAVAEASAYPRPPRGRHSKPRDS
jgi:hypothetical protein